MDIRAHIPEVLPDLRRALYGLLRSPDHETVNELVQVSVLKALENCDRHFDGQNLIGWLFTIAKFHHFDQRRKASRHSSVFTDWDDSVLEVSTPSHEAQVLAYIELEQVAHHIAFDLQGKTQRVVMLATLRGDEVADISERYGRTRRWVQNAIGRARLRLSELQDWRDL